MSSQRTVGDFSSRSNIFMTDPTFFSAIQKPDWLTQMETVLEVLKRPDDADQAFHSTVIELAPLLPKLSEVSSPAPTGRTAPR